MTFTKNTVTASFVIYFNPIIDGLVTINWSNANMQINRIDTISVVNRFERIVINFNNLSIGSGISTNVDLGLKKYRHGYVS